VTHCFDSVSVQVAYKRCEIVFPVLRTKLRWTFVDRATCNGRFIETHYGFSGCHSEREMRAIALNREAFYDLFDRKTVIAPWASIAYGIARTPDAHQSERR
jgi:hypothetical protein